jgi:hypothetical protein
MAQAATIVTLLAIAGAVASWIVGAVFYLRTLRELPAQPRLKWLAVAAWPFTVGRIRGAAAEQAAKVNKAMVAFFTCLMIAIAATSLATNLSRLSR